MIDDRFDDAINSLAATNRRLNPAPPSIATAKAAGLSTDDRLIGWKELSRLVPVARMTIWRWEREKKFPRHRKAGGRNVWLLSEILGWMEALPTA